MYSFFYFLLLINKVLLIVLIEWSIFYAGKDMHYCFWNLLIFILLFTWNFGSWLQYIGENMPVLLFFKTLILEKGGGKREKGWGAEKEKEKRRFCCSTHLCIHWSVLVCALTRDWTLNLGILGQCSNQLSYLVRASIIVEYLPFHILASCWGRRKFPPFSLSSSGW